ncbi:MAG: hypothetical protein CMF49_00575 [Legionellales bacterium]|nr:hypothetical protein [Legionellales bacterium]|tara:strand:- start:440 stop:652 length:213 start_codon:yes stop_codon:yes gene_type:complete
MNHFIESCTACAGRMACEKVASWSNTGFIDKYFMICSICGYGPSRAYPQKQLAISAWNAHVLEDLAEFAD